MEFPLLETLSGLLLIVVTGLFFVTKHKSSRKQVTRDKLYVTFLTFAIMMTGFIWTVLLKSVGETLCQSCW